MDEIEQVTWCTASHNGVPQVLDFIRKFYFIFYWELSRDKSNLGKWNVL